MDMYIEWARNISSYRSKIHNGEKIVEMVQADFLKKFDSYFSWINDYQDEIKEWHQICSILVLAKNEVKINGLQSQTTINFQEKINAMENTSVRLNKITGNLSNFLKEETKGIPEGEKWLGTSDIIESIFGKYKIFSSRTTMRGIGKVILTIPVFTSSITIEKIKIAMETISINTLSNWINENLGPSFFSKRKLAFCP